MMLCAMGFKISADACETCGATDDETCRRWVRAAIEIVEAAQALNLLEDFSEAIGPEQAPQDWDTYNAARKRLGDALKIIPLEVDP